MFCYRKKNLLEIQAFDSIMNSQVPLLANSWGFPLSKKHVRVGEFSFASFLPVFHSFPWSFKFDM